MRFWFFIWISLSSSRRDIYIVRNIFSISSRLSFGSSRVFDFWGFGGRGAGAGLMAGAGRGSAFATAFAVKAAVGSSPSAFFTSLRTLVSLMILVGVSEPGAVATGS